MLRERPRREPLLLLLSVDCVEVDRGSPALLVRDIDGRLCSSLCFTSLSDMDGEGPPTSLDMLRMAECKSECVRARLAF